MVELAPANREAGSGSASVTALEGGAIGRRQHHPAQGPGIEGSDEGLGPERCEEPPGLGRDRLAADLVPREDRFVDEHDVAPERAKKDGGGRAGRSTSHDDNLAAGAHPAPSRRATATRR
jgi:hypothetical protein